MLIIPASLALIFLLLYLAFRSLLDVTVILSNVVFSAIGGIWKDRFENYQVHLYRISPSR